MGARILPEQPGAERQVAGQVEGGGGGLLQSVARSPGRTGSIARRGAAWSRVEDELVRPTLLGGEAGAQALVARTTSASAAWRASGSRSPSRRIARGML